MGLTSHVACPSCNSIHISSPFAHGDKSMFRLLHPLSPLFFSPSSAFPQHMCTSEQCAQWVKVHPVVQEGRSMAQWYAALRRRLRSMLCLLWCPFSAWWACWVSSSATSWRRRDTAALLTRREAMKKLPHLKKKVRWNDRDFDRDNTGRKWKDEKRVKIEGKRFKMVGGVITETSIYVQVFVSFAVKIAKREASQRCGYVVCVREKPKRKSSVFVCSHSPCVSVMWKHESLHGRGFF